MVVAMVPDQHEVITLRDAAPAVNSEYSIRRIGFSDSQSSALSYRFARGWLTAEC